MRSTRFLLLAASTAALAACSGTAAKADDDAVTLHALDRPGFTSADSDDSASDRVADEIVVDFKDGFTKAQFDALEQDWGIDLELADQEEGQDSAITVAHLAAGEDVDALLARIRANPDVEAAEPLMTFHSSYVPNDPDFEKQWNLKAINMPKAWERSRGKGVVVAVLDTGVAYENYDGFIQVPDLEGVTFVPGYDFVNQDSHPNDDHGHGTHVAGTIAQATNNGKGVAGVAFEASVMPVKVLDHFGSGTTAAIADAIRWAADHGAQVINMSLGGGGRSAVLENAVAYARKKGVVVVAAAGNNGRGTVEYPAAYPGAVAVGAVGPTGAKAPYSSWGKELDVAAPGGDKSQGEAGGILQNTIDPQDPSRSVYASYQGTSMATPHVAAVAALLWAAGAKSPDQVEKAIFASAHPPQGQRGWTEQFGHGVIDADAALKALKKVSAAGDFTPTEVPATGEQVMGVGASSQPAVLAFPSVEWAPLAWGAALLVLALVTLNKRARPGYLNVLLRPAFALPLVLATVGVFALRWVVPPSEVSVAWTLPLPDWLQKIIFGRGTLANPLVYSALGPIIASLVAIKAKGFRPVVAGLAIGFAGILGYTAWAKAPALAWLPFTFLAIPWLVVNALICVVIARAMLKKDA
ncbi:MAG: S8 family peptidase [Myxococcaceae bacterium]|nr:S8 family peptidase [Myxococcaceae bacterium]